LSFFSSRSCKPLLLQARNAVTLPLSKQTVSFHPGLRKQIRAPLMSTIESATTFKFACSFSSNTTTIWSVIARVGFVTSWVGLPFRDFSRNHLISWNCDHRLIQRPREAFGCHAFERKPRETCVLIGTKSVNLGIRPSNLAYGTGFARGKTGTALPKRKSCANLAIKPRSSGECRFVDRALPWRINAIHKMIGSP
jgi:hypothetical protein